MTASAVGADKVLTIDGCDVACAKKCLGILDYEYVVVTDLDMQRSTFFNLTEADIEAAIQACRKKLGMQGLLEPHV